MYRKEDELDSKRPEDLLFKTPLCSKKKSIKPVIGGLYEVMVDRTGGGCTVKGTANWIMGQEAPKEKQIEWSARDEAEYAEYHETRALKKAKAEDPMYEALEAIKRAYWNTNVTGQRAIIAKVLRYIMAGPPKRG